MQFVIGVRAFEQFTEPIALSPRVPWEVQHDGYAAREQTADVICESSAQAGRELREGRDIDDVARKQAAQPLILNEKDRTFSLRKVPRQGGLSRGHLAAEEVEVAVFGIDSSPSNAWRLSGRR